MFADASNEFYGQFLIVALGIIGGLGGLAAIASYFATRRELESLVTRVNKIETEVKEDREKNQIHASQRSHTIFDAIEKLRTEVTKRIDERCDKQDLRINRTMIGVAALCARSNIQMPAEEK